ncbi:hypothetical protein [Pseudomonas psychrophila]|uniref:Uncharacterized protein n=1 Tax=Pseudomonas psychrophila TaxID=122355 RepID=A0A8I1FWW9_9PSED|nr:hypothetical protein [Pseudomonas psychrophila]EPJ93956.1 hypothetical protein CF149_10983 [Pseudomonas psychrophila]KAB0489812.1 hypothetical protein F7Q95_12990 [Pseudomonas psychrophila]KMN01528.1 hypothetical protein TU76_07845 [Pseudomonas psychrophila]KOX63799.1 hypothetical protein AA303_17005 [Pseudomonas psychrophila]MBJ2259578.1 hypothetical protein [Pseudomonas psychrophila]
MTIEREIFSALIAQNAFQGEKPSVHSFAQLAVDKGFRALSSRQQAVVNPFLKKQCEGIKQPNEKHNNCKNSIGGRDLVTALEKSESYKGWRCESCRSAV